MLEQTHDEMEYKIYLPFSDCRSLTYPCQEGLISFSNDEGKHGDKQVEWWYANFNVTTSPGLIPLAGVISLVRANPGREDQGYALLEITDESASKFFYRVLTGSITSSVGSQNVEFVADPGTEVNQIKFYQDDKDFQYKLEVSGRGIDIDIALPSQKRPLVEGGDDYVPIFANYPSEESGYYSLTKLLVSNGQVKLPDTPSFAINGIAWIDHQWFNVPFGFSISYDPFLLRPHHEWFSIQLDNNVQIVAWKFLKRLPPRT